MSRVETTQGRAEEAAILAAVRAGDQAAFQLVATAANRQPAAACYLRRHGHAEYRLVGLNVLRVEGGEIVEITSFGPELVWGFGLPPAL